MRRCEIIYVKQANGTGWKWRAVSVDDKPEPLSRETFDLFYDCVTAARAKGFQPDRREEEVRRRAGERDDGVAAAGTASEAPWVHRCRLGPAEAGQQQEGRTDWVQVGDWVECQAPLALGGVVFLVCLLASGLGVRAALKADPATALGG